MKMTFPTYEEWSEKVAEQVIDVYLINGRTIREWIEILSDELTMLDKIREEINGLIKYYPYPVVSPYQTNNYAMLMEDEVLHIIDKYKEGEQP